MTALVLFLKNPQTQSVKTRLAATLGRDVATKVYASFLDLLKNSLSKLGHDFCLIVSPSHTEDAAWAKKFFGADCIPQPEGDLGVRLATVANTVLKKHARVIIIGSDSPTLSRAWIAQAARLLEQTPAVLGPTDDGGFYLLGLSRPVEHLDQVRWSTTAAYKDTRRCLEAQGFDVSLTPPWFDVDTEEDLLRLLETEEENATPEWRQLKKLVAPRFSVIIPVVNEETALKKIVPQLRALNPAPEIIVVDGGSKDGSVNYCRSEEVEVISVTPASRGAQMNAGARVAKGEVLLFLHADCELSQAAVTAMRQEMAKGSLDGGAFSFRLVGSSERWKLRFIEFGAHLRNKYFKAPYGDQGFFVRRNAFEAMEPFKEWPLLEDVEWFQRLRKRFEIKILDVELPTSPRRMVQRGVLRNMFLNWGIMCAYHAGVSPKKLAKLYRL